MKKVLELADDYLWDIRWNFTKFCIRVDDIFSLFGKYPGYAIESTTKGNLPVAYWTELPGDDELVLVADKPENFGVLKQYYVFWDEDKWVSDKPTEYQGIKIN